MGERVGEAEGDGDSDPEAEADGVVDGDSEAEQGHGGGERERKCQVDMWCWGSSCHLPCQNPYVWLWHQRRGGIPEADSDADGDGAVAQAKHMGRQQCFQLLCKNDPWSGPGRC